MNFLRSLLVLSVLFAAACTSTSSSPQCSPPCRSGFACVAGACVSGCNPPCANGMVCSGYGAGATCVPGFADGSVNDAMSDGAPPMDVTAADVTGSDVVSNDSIGIDAASSDGATDASDATSSSDGSDASDVAVDAPPPCGHTGETCCYTTFCEPGNECAGGTCQTLVRATGECTSPADCTGGQACFGPTTCGDHGCFQCATATGTTPFGGSCTSAADCATGVCRGQHCTVACDLGGTGDTECAARSAGYICTQLLYRTGTAPMTTVVALGTCRQSCARLGDCTGTETCIPQLNDATNTMDFICGVTSGTLPVGATCTDGSACMSFLCLPGFGDGGTSGVCTAPCVADSDCPAAAPHCSPITWSRPDGTAQPGHGCTP